ncbi:DUF5683 domain-containing protein [Ulvibacter litoralis]|uniref:DUF5683 domain-containing protein n=1 Tax=Ulvibacter litoralis TaxID=227084 RepID=UPI000B85AF0C|nr:DUF5683 domain-containing protein [Ulvibacter litoralis]
MRNRALYILFFLLATSLFAQKADSLKVKEISGLVIQDTLIFKETYDPLAPARAAFYSAVVPGLGQAYNKKYWKIPLVYAGMGAGVYFYLRNDKDYDRFRDAYKRRLAGFTDDEFYGTGTTPTISTYRLVDAQIDAQKNKDISIIVTVAFYLLNIVDANVDAHFRQFNVSDDLSIQPNLDFNPIHTQANYGLSFTYRIK